MFGHLLKEFKDPSWTISCLNYFKFLDELNTFFIKMHRFIHHYQQNLMLYIRTDYFYF
jgi:hypothetical protein